MNVVEIKKIASEFFTDYLNHTIDFICSGLAEKNNIPDDFFPLDIMINTSRFSDFLKEHSQEMAELFLYSKNKTGTGYSLEMESVNTRSNGRKSIIKRIYFADENDYLTFINVKSRVEDLKSALRVLAQDAILPIAELKVWAKNHIRELTAPQGETTRFWHSIAQCAIWLKNNKNTKEIPLHISTEFIDTNKSLLQSFTGEEIETKQFTPPAQEPKTSEAPDDQSVIDSVGNDNQPEIKTKPFSIRFRSLSTETPLKLGRLVPKEIALPLDDFVHLNQTSFLKEITTVLIVNSETIFQTFPSFNHVLCIFGPDYAVNALKLCDWFGQVQIIYFGDISEHCFDVLSAFRNSWPKAESLCMDGNTWEKFFNFTENGAHLRNNAVPKNLSTSEKNTFLSLRLTPEKSRLPQEKIPMDYAKQILDTMVVKKDSEKTPSKETKSSEQKKENKPEETKQQEPKTDVQQEN